MRKNIRSEHVMIPFVWNLSDEDCPLGGAKPRPKGWVEFMKFDEGFEEELSKLSLTGSFPVVRGFTPDMYGNAYSQMELAASSGEDGPESAWV